MDRGRLPLWLKIAFSAWIVVWAPTYAVVIGPQNFFWLCNMASFLILIGLWMESRLVLSMQWLSVALIGLLWGLDVASAWLTGSHLFGGTEYMFDPETPRIVRVLSFFHLLLPLVAGPAVWRLGYDRRALIWQSGLTWLMIALSWWLTDAERNINWVHAPFGLDQAPASELIYLPALALGWVVLILLPVHLITRRLA